MERIITTYRAGNPITKETLLKKRMITMINLIKTKIANKQKKANEELAQSNTYRNYDIERELVKAKASLVNFSQSRHLC